MPKVEVKDQPESEEQAAAMPEAAATPAEPEVNAVVAQIAELTNDLQRTRADFENFREQTEAQRAQAMNLAKSATVNQFLPLVDDLQRAIEAYPEQLSPLRKNFEKTLSTLGLKPIESKPGTEFNPDYHEAVSVEDGEGEVEVIAETLRPGYLYEGVVIRPAMVKVTRQTLA